MTSDATFLYVAQMALIGALASLFFIALRSGRLPETPALLLVESGLVLGLGLAYGPVTEVGYFLILLLPAAMGTALLARARGGRWIIAASAWGFLGVLMDEPLRVCQRIKSSKETAG